MMIIIISAILVIVAGIAKAFMDTLQFHYYEMRWKLNPQYWNPEISWQNKYNWGKGKGKVIEWLLQNPLVFITDGWHLMQFIFLNSIMIIPAIMQPWYNWILVFFGIRVIFGVLFSLFYNLVLIKKSGS
jgi:hypothetical protein